MADRTRHIHNRGVSRVVSRLHYKIKRNVNFVGVGTKGRTILESDSELYRLECVFPAIFIEGRKVWPEAAGKVNDCASCPVVLFQPKNPSSPTKRETLCGRPIDQVIRNNFLPFHCLASRIFKRSVSIASQNIRALLLVSLAARCTHPSAGMGQRLVLGFEHAREIGVANFTVGEFNRQHGPLFLPVQGDPTTVVLIASKAMLCRDETHAGPPPIEIATLKQSSWGSRA